MAEAGYQVSVINGQGANPVPIADYNPSRHYLEITNVGYGPAFVGDRNNVDPAGGLGTRIRPGERRSFATHSGMWAVTWVNSNYTLEVIEE